MTWDIAFGAMGAVSTVAAGVWWVYRLGQHKGREIAQTDALVQRIDALEEQTAARHAEVRAWLNMLAEAVRGVDDKLTDYIKHFNVGLSEVGMRRKAR